MLSDGKSMWGTFGKLEQQNQVSSLCFHDRPKLILTYTF
jgi:hypothetical protein